MCTSSKKSNTNSLYPSIDLGYVSSPLNQTDEICILVVALGYFFVLTDQTDEICKLATKISFYVNEYIKKYYVLYIYIEAQKEK